MFGPLFQFLRNVSIHLRSIHILRHGGEEKFQKLVTFDAKMKDVSGDVSKFFDKLKCQHLLFCTNYYLLPQVNDFSLKMNQNLIKVSGNKGWKFYTGKEIYSIWNQCSPVIRYLKMTLKIFIYISKTFTSKRSGSAEFFSLLVSFCNIKYDRWCFQTKIVFVL